MSSDNPPNLRVVGRDLRYYVFDWDDNILHMPTRIHMERRGDDGRWAPHPVSTAVFSMIRTDTARYRPEQNDWECACRDFRDLEVGDENIFLRDTRLAIDRVVAGRERAAPSFRRFRNALTEGRLFAIVTARGHAPGIIRAGVQYFIDQVLTERERLQMLANLKGYLECFVPGHGCRSDRDVLDYYLGHNRYHGVRSPHFRELMRKRGAEMTGTEHGKQFAIRHFVEHVIHLSKERGLTKPISVGFSDDDELNAMAVEDFIRDELSKEFPAVKFVVYYAAGPTRDETRKVEVHGQLTLPLSGA